MKCDAGERFPAGCSRCTKAKKTCSIEPGYKTPSKDEYGHHSGFRANQVDADSFSLRRLEELERELQTLRADIARHRSKSPRTHTSGEGSPKSRENSFDAGSSVSTTIEATAQVILVESRHLEGFEISPSEFDELVGM